MARHIIFKCARTGLNVQHRIEPDSPRGDTNADDYATVECPACASLHLISLKTGKAPGER